LLAIKSQSLTSRNIAKLIAEFASEKKAFDILILDMRKLVNFCDYFVICSGNTDRQVIAIAEGIQEGVEKKNMRVPHLQGARDARWVVMDFGSVIVHIFEKQTREFYGLDYLWQEAKKVEWP